MKMKQLEYLIKIAECGSISKAAQELYISQPSLTKAISGLEEEFHVQLLLRKPRGVELTIEGKSFLHYNHYDSMAQVVERIRKITAEEILAVANEVYAPSNLSTLIYE